MCATGKYYHAQPKILYNIDANISAAKMHHSEQTMPENTNLRPSF